LLGESKYKIAAKLTTVVRGLKRALRIKKKICISKGMLLKQGMGNGEGGMGNGE